MSRQAVHPVSLPTLRAHIAAGWMPMDPRIVLAFIEAIEADHAFHIYGTPQAWHRRETAFAVFDYGDAAL